MSRGGPGRQGVRDAGVLAAPEPHTPPHQHRLEPLFHGLHRPVPAAHAPEHDTSGEEPVAAAAAGHHLVPLPLIQAQRRVAGHDVEADERGAVLPREAVSPCEEVRPQALPLRRRVHREPLNICLPLAQLVPHLRGQRRVAGVPAQLQLARRNDGARSVPHHGTVPELLGARRAVARVSVSLVLGVLHLAGGAAAAGEGALVCERPGAEEGEAGDVRVVQEVNLPSGVPRRGAFGLHDLRGPSVSHHSGPPLVWHCKATTREVLDEGGGGSGTQKFVYQKWPNQIFPIVNFGFSYNGHFGLGGGGGGGGGGSTSPPHTVSLATTCSWCNPNQN